MASIEHMIAQYQSYHLDQIIDHEKFNEYAIVHHSTVIEGSTLTENETRLLLDEGLTPKGKPLIHSLMVKDHYEALKFTLLAAAEKRPITVSLIREINACVMKSTGSVYNTPLGQVDASKGEFRKGNVSAGGSYFVNFDKVILYTTRLAESLAEKINSVKTVKEKLDLSFSAHFDLVTIHPFYDGNGRTSRLLMNFIQRYFDLPLAIVYLQDKSDYFTALQDSRSAESLEPFLNFMCGQYEKFLLEEIKQYRKLMGELPDDR